MTREEIKKLAEKVKKAKEAKENPKPEFDNEKHLKKVEAANAKRRKYYAKKEPVKDSLQVLLEEKQKQSAILTAPVIMTSDTSWDVTLKDKVEYFDPALSYELGKYRPINAVKGLDFDPKAFTQAADMYRKNGRYTTLLPGTFLHRNHWKQEMDRCHDGYTVDKYTLTGENYFFLNYYRLPSVLGTDQTESRSEDFPAFLAKQYEYFHYLNLARLVGKDALAFKSRGVN